MSPLPPLLFVVIESNSLQWMFAVNWESWGSCVYFQNILQCLNPPLNDYNWSDCFSCSHQSARSRLLQRTFLITSYHLCNELFQIFCASCGYEFDIYFINRIGSASILNLCPLIDVECLLLLLLQLHTWFEFMFKAPQFQISSIEAGPNAMKLVENWFKYLWTARLFKIIRKYEGFVFRISRR